MKTILNSIFLIFIALLSSASHAQQTIYVGEFPNIRMFFVCDVSRNAFGFSDTLCFVDENGERIVNVYFRGIDKNAGNDSRQTWYLDCRRRAINYKSGIVSGKNLRSYELAGLKEGCRL
jgi:hypothetical protein